MTEITLTLDQQAALDSFVQFLLDPNTPVWVLVGYAGTGKSTLVHTLLDRLPSYIESAKLIDPDYEELTVQLTATTNKAAEQFSHITGMDVKTIHSFLGLRVDSSEGFGKKRLVAGRNAEVKYDHLIFIDEASMIDSELLTLIFQQTKDCKIVFIGDPAQLPPVKSEKTPVFDAKFPTAKLEKVMRQMVDGKPCANPITEMATAFRETVTSGVWPTGFKPDGQFVRWLPPEQFQAELEAEFTRPDWSFRDSKILAWRNERVIQFNRHVRALLKGDPSIQVGDYVDNNSFVQIGKQSIKTDQTVFVSGIEDDTEEDGVVGNWVTLDYTIRAFHPKSRDAKQKALNLAKAADDGRKYQRIESWVDLRAVFSQTVNKSQGSTFDRVFIDLSDIAKCTKGNLIARLLYVAFSRARSQVILTGDIA